MLQKASNVVVVCVTVLILAAIAGAIFLIYKGKGTSDFTGVITTLMSALSLLGVGGTWLYSAAGAKSSHNAEQQTNGSLDARITTAISTALMTHDTLVHGVVPQIPPPLLATPTPDGTDGTAPSQPSH